MGRADKTPSTDPRIRRSERAALDAARGLFEQQGYVATTMAQIARAADLAERTLFLRFESKAHLLRRLVDETLAGGDAPDPRRTAMLTAPTLEERLRAFSEGTADALVRTGPMFAVAREAEASEPVIRAAFDAGRRGSMRASRRLWQHLADDGLLHHGVDVDWAADTAGLLASPDTYLVMRTTLGWSRDELAAWFHRTWVHLATTPSPPPTSR